MVQALPSEENDVPPLRSIAPRGWSRGHPVTRVDVVDNEATFARRRSAASIRATVPDSNA
jgi:hypothetical protein